MKPMICTSRSGIRRRRRPSRTSWGSVVAASVSEASTPSEPLASSANAASSPVSETVNHSTSVCGPVATNGTRIAKSTNGSSITIRLNR